MITLYTDKMPHDKKWPDEEALNVQILGWLPAKLEQCR